MLPTLTKEKTHLKVEQESATTCSHICLNIFNLLLNKQRFVWKVIKLRLKPFLAIFVLILLTSMIVTGVQAQTNGENNGIETESEEGGFHCALGGMGFLMVLATLTAGFLVSGRFGRIAGFKPLPIHKLVVLSMALYLTGEFIYGSTVQNVFFLNSTHGTLGFLTITLAWITLSLNPLGLRRAVKWKTATRIHLFFASSVFVMLIIHLSYAFSVLGD